MYLLVTPKGQKWWRFDYRIEGKRYTLSLGVYDDVSLKTARERRSEARELVAKGINPSKVRKKDKVALAKARTFEEVAEEWREKKALAWNPEHTERVHSRLKAYVYPWLGNEAIDGIPAPALLEVLRRVENKGALETARKLRGYCGQVFRYAIASGDPLWVSSRRRSTPGFSHRAHARHTRLEGGNAAAKYGRQQRRCGSG